MGLRKMPVVWLIGLALCWTGLTGFANAETYYYIAHYSPQPSDDADVSEEPLLTAEVISIETDSQPEPPPANDDVVGFRQVTLAELQALAYEAPEVVLDQARTAGGVEEEEQDGWGVVAYINRGYSGMFYKRVQLGGRVWRHWYNPGPISHRYTCGTKRHHGVVNYASGWLTRWGWSINRYRDYTYSRLSTWEWWSQIYGTSRYDHRYPVSRTVVRWW